MKIGGLFVLCCVVCCKSCVLATIVFSSALVLLFLVAPVLLVNEKDDDVLDNLDKVDEEFEGVSDEVTVATALLQHDHLSVPHDKATEDGKANPHVKLKQHLRLKEEVCQSHPEESGESADQGPSQVEVLSVRSNEGGAGE